MGRSMFKILVGCCLKDFGHMAFLTWSKHVQNGAFRYDYLASAWRKALVRKSVRLLLAVWFKCCTEFAQLSATAVKVNSVFEELASTHNIEVKVKLSIKHVSI